MNPVFNERSLMKCVISDIDATLFRMNAGRVDLVDEATGSTVVCWVNPETKEVMVQSVTLK